MKRKVLAILMLIFMSTSIISQAQELKSLRGFEFGVNIYTPFHYFYRIFNVPKESGYFISNFDSARNLKDFIVKYHFGKVSINSTFFYRKFVGPLTYITYNDTIHTYYTSRYLEGSIGFQINKLYRNVNFFYGFDLALSKIRTIRQIPSKLNRDFVITGATHFYWGLNFFLTEKISLSTEYTLEYARVLHYEQLNEVKDIHPYLIKFIPNTYLAINFHLR